LRRNGYLELRPDPTDGRARLVHLTSRGKAAVRVAISEIAAIEARWQETATRAGLTVNLRQFLADLENQHRAHEIREPR
jgi:DNA-binding MarR family transcriptional regulator